MSGTIIDIDPLLGGPGADEIVALAKRFGRYRSYAEHENIELSIGPGLAPRHDSIANFVRQGGLEASVEPPAALVRRTAYFREEYAYGDVVAAPGIEGFLHHPKLVAAAQHLYDRPVVQPAIAYANLMAPGQELAVHTDVPEFRGLNRKVVPQWLLVAMHHSGLFDDHRLPIATGIAWFGNVPGGQLVVWSGGADEGPVLHAAAHDTTAVLDTDSVFHGVARVGSADAAPPPPLTARSELHAAGDGWDLLDPDGTALAHWADDEIRLSVSWKAYVFADEADRTRWRDHTEDLAVEPVLDRLHAGLVERLGVVRPGRRDPTLGQALIDTYITFPG